MMSAYMNSTETQSKTQPETQPEKQPETQPVQTGIKPVGFVFGISPTQNTANMAFQPTHTRMNSCFGPLPPSNQNQTQNPGFIGLGGCVQRHPETGLPMGCNLRPPQGVCGINNPTNTSEILNSQSSNKQKIIDELYKKLANARAQIQNLNKSIDDIYEIIPKIN